MNHSLRTNPSPRSTAREMMLAIMPDSRGCGALSIFPGFLHVKEARGATGRRVFVSDNASEKLGGFVFISLPDVGRFGAGAGGTDR